MRLKPQFFAVIGHIGEETAARLTFRVRATLPLAHYPAASRYDILLTFYVSDPNMCQKDFCKSETIWKFVSRCHDISQNMIFPQPSGFCALN